MNNSFIIKYIVIALVFISCADRNKTEPTNKEITRILNFAVNHTFGDILVDSEKLRNMTVFCENKNLNIDAKNITLKIKKYSFNLGKNCDELDKKENYIIKFTQLNFNKNMATLNLTDGDNQKYFFEFKKENGVWKKSSPTIH